MLSGSSHTTGHRQPRHGGPRWVSGQCRLHQPVTAFTIAVLGAKCFVSPFNCVEATWTSWIQSWELLTGPGLGSTESSLELAPADASSLQLHELGQDPSTTVELEAATRRKQCRVDASAYEE